MKKHSVMISGHRTSVTLEPEFWAQLQQIACAKGVSLASIVTDIDNTRTTNLSGALRLFVLKSLQEVINQEKSK